MYAVFRASSYSLLGKIVFCVVGGYRGTASCIYRVHESVLVTGPRTRRHASGNMLETRQESHRSSNA